MRLVTTQVSFSGSAQTFGPDGSMSVVSAMCRSSACSVKVRTTASTSGARSRAMVRIEIALAALEQLGGQGKRGERRLEFVRERGDEVGACPVLVTQIGDVLQDQDGAEWLAVAMLERHWLQDVGVITAANVQIHLDALRIRRTIAAGAAQRRAHAHVVRMVAVEVVERAAERLVLLDA